MPLLELFGRFSRETSLKADLFPRILFDGFFLRHGTLYSLLKSLADVEINLIGEYRMTESARKFPFST